MINGHIKLYRQMEDWGWYKDNNTKALFIHLLFKANWKEGCFMGYEIPRGSLATSLENLSLETGLTIQEIRTSLKKLELTGEISKKSTNKFTIINVANYSNFQDDEVKSNKRTTNKQQTSNKQLTTIEESNKNNNIISINRNNKRYYENEKLNNTFNDYLEVRKKLKVATSERAIEILINKLSEYTDLEKIEMLENAIVNGWKSVYPLKKSINNNLPF